MLKKTLSIFLASRLIIAILIIAAVSFAATPSEKETRILEGTIINKTVGLVTVGAKKQPGQIVTLSVDPNSNLTAFHVGDQVLIEYNSDYMVQSVTKQS